MTNSGTPQPRQADTADFGFGTQIRKSPYFDATVRWGATGFSTYNHMYIPATSGIRSRTSGISSTRRSSATSPSSARSRSPARRRPLHPTAHLRDLSTMQVGQCKYILITNAEGGLLNDPVLLRLAEDHFWISLADSDILLWAQGVATHAGMDVSIREPDVSPLQLQGPKSGAIMTALFGDWIEELAYYWLRETELDGIPLVVSRTGWSSELGYEIYLRDGSRGDELWEKIMAVGAPLVSSRSHLVDSSHRGRHAQLPRRRHHRHESLRARPRPTGRRRQCRRLHRQGRPASIRDEGVTRKQAGIVIEMEPLTGPNTTFWPITAGGERAGEVTSAVWSPRLAQNIALAMVRVDAPSGHRVDGRDKPGPEGGDGRREAVLRPEEVTRDS